MLVFPGCGPGVGGTGTGDAALAAFSASAASVCGGAIAAELSCSAPSGPAGPAAPGTLPVQFVDAAGRITLDLNGNLARLDSSCLRLRFSGEFGNGTGGTQGFFGSYEIDGNGVDVLAALSAVPVAGAGALTIELRDIDGRVALGPVLLRRAAVPLLAPNSC
ncbi:MAG: hypothetical protein ACXWCV_13560 [Caldimonas sp.]